MDWKEKTLLGTGAGVGAFILGAKSIESRMTPDKPANVNLGSDIVEVHVMCLNEEGWIRKCLQSLKNQNLYRESGNVRIVVVDSFSTDDTVGVAEELADEVWSVSRGKLNARNEAVRRSDGDIIVSTDADCTFPDYWLGNLLKPFEREGVVAVHGPVLSEDLLYSAFRAWHNLVRKNYGPFSGRNSVFKRRAYFKCGGFDLSVDQYDREGELNEEEEYRFKEKLETVGEVVWVGNAGVFTSERQMPINTSDGEVEKYKEERRSGLRF